MPNHIARRIAVLLLLEEAIGPGWFVGDVIMIFRVVGDDE
jgi:hypothetical protein